MVGLLGPDFLFGIAIGQLSSARRSVKADRKLSKGMKWTYRHAFFVDMGGIFLTSPDFPEGFPINAQQFHYLIKHDYIDFPNMDEMHISERNSADTLSRLITMWQVLWFSIAEIQRARTGLPLTTLELTALSYAFVIIITSVCWYRKPAITHPRNVPTKNDKTIDEIRAAIKETTHPNLDLGVWYRTPVDFLSGPRWRIEAHWSYYVRLSEILHIPLVSRRMNSRPWNRFPSDMWLPPDLFYTPYGCFILLWFSASFLIAWNFQFPTEVEQQLWRACSVYCAVFMIYGFVYYVISWYMWKKAIEGNGVPRSRPGPRSVRKAPLNPTTLLSGDQEQAIDTDTVILEARSCPKGPMRVIHRLLAVLGRMRNISIDKDPEMAVPLHVMIPVTITCVVYTFCRLFLYVEDFLSLRTQPIGVYYTVNKFIPFLGD
ncbi:hypothetical protein PFICI_00783 [Pestalotiopsis fici W106-1]|uniref:Uncharacterized protein n=1 Tax=Pestalotiopsis fici (strain W106-1 / CGMCC3.15140) TaxID=1229662 RepID=W3XLU8_PESFW|nr:uncharacterized protein PFICI_00783 [Pestalotiopsis fici W106-1]ETS86955.1 hypothetical protein PFICI_00783 [Pestalotiopsis fici W106-1]